MAKIYKVFVSSTFEDLREERAAVQKALLKLNCLPVGMELFPSSDDETWEFIKKQIKDSDYYILIVAGKYGSVAKAGGKSFTEMEFDFAVKERKPAIGFVRRNIEQLMAKHVEKDLVREQKLQNFTERVKKRPVCFYETAHELAMEVTTSFVDLIEKKPAEGYIRADSAVSFQKYSELQQKNADLERLVRQSDSSSSDKKLMTWFDSEISIKGDDNEIRKMRWRDIAVAVITLMAQDDSEQYILTEIGEKLGFKETSSESNVLITAQLFLKGVITTHTEQRSRRANSFTVSLEPERVVTYNERVWRLTEYGRKHLSLLLDGEA